MSGQGLSRLKRLPHHGIDVYSILLFSHMSFPGGQLYRQMALFVKKSLEFFSFTKSGWRTTCAKCAKPDS